MTIEERIWAYISKTLVRGGEPKSLEDFVFDRKLDSLSHVKLIFFLEKEFGIALDIDEVRRSDLTTIKSVADLVRSKLPNSGHG